MQKTGCFDLTCPGFVQTSSDIVLGGYIGDLYGSDIVIQISKVSKDRYTYPNLSYIQSHYNQRIPTAIEHSILHTYWTNSNTLYLKKT